MAPFRRPLLQSSDGRISNVIQRNLPERCLANKGLGNNTPKFSIFNTLTLQPLLCLICFFFSFCDFPCFLLRFSFVFPGFEGSVQRKPLFFFRVSLFFQTEKMQGLEGQGINRPPSPAMDFSSLSPPASRASSKRIRNVHQDFYWAGPSGAKCPSNKSGPQWGLPLFGRYGLKVGFGDKRMAQEPNRNWKPEPFFQGISPEPSEPFFSGTETATEPSRTL